MTTIENDDFSLKQYMLGIDLLEMTTIENDDFSLKQYMLGIDLFEMTTIENWTVLLSGNSRRYWPA